MTYPWVNQRLNGRINGEVEEIISSIANPYARYWGLNDAERENTRNIIEQLLPTSESLNDYYLKASTLSLSQILGLIHVHFGGMEETNDRLLQLTTEALDALMRRGRASRISKDRWIITQYPLEIYGEGENWIYLYYFLDDEVRARVKANPSDQFAGREVEWPCNIGKTTNRKPEHRIIQQLQKSSRLSEDWVIRLFLRTDEESKLERVIHAVLKLYGKHIPPGSMRGEKEWFLTNPDIVCRIYDSIIDLNIPGVGI